MKNIELNGVLSLIILIMVIIPGSGCRHAPNKPLDPEQDLNSLLSMAEATSKTFSQTGVFVKMQDDTAIIMNTIREGAKLKLNTIGKIALTERCLKTKTYTSEKKAVAGMTFAYDSMYLALIGTRLKEIENQLVANGDPTFFDLWVRNEKFRALLGKLNMICPTSDSTLFQ